MNNNLFERRLSSASICVICGPTFFLLAFAGFLLLATSRSAHACGGCFKLPYQSLLEKVERADRVVVAHATDATGSAWKIDRVIKGRELSDDETIQADKLAPTSRSNFHGPHILRWNRVFDSWTIEAPANPELVEFLSRAIGLSAIGRELMPVRHQAGQLRFFLPYVENADRQIADSTHAKLSGAPYAVLQELSDDLDADQLLKWIDDQPATNLKRVALSIVLLGICGEQREADLVKQWIDECPPGGDQAYLAALFTAHLELGGEESVRFLEESYLQNHDRTLGELIAVIDALRTHGQAETTVSRQRVKTSFHLLLRQRPPLAETIIEDFARWEDWSIAPRLMEIHASGKQPWNNALITNYLKACPLPAAKEFLTRVSGIPEPTESPSSAEHYYFHKTEKKNPHAAEWGYSGEIGPSHWGQLCPEYALAKDGKRQSPIDVRNPLAKTLPKLDFQYRPSRIHLVYNGHTIQENEDPGSFGMANEKFELQQFHFHAPSEHTVDGKHFPMEMHLVHKAEDGTSGVVAVFIQEGEHNRAFDPVWDNLPDANRPEHDVQIKVDTLSLLPKDTSYFAYEGSFTTPPCTEQVKWVILAQPVDLSREQIMRFREVIHDNNRPVQPLHGRSVFRSAQQ